MRKYYIPIFLGLVLLLGGFLPERKSPVPPAKYEQYTQIPGVTTEEIVAIEALKKKHRELTLGMNITNTSFIAENNAVGGFARLLGERLSGLFGIRFVPSLHGWADLNDKMDLAALDFTGELSPTPERQQRYFMTDHIFNLVIRVFTNMNKPPLGVRAKERPLRVGFLKKSTTYALVKDSWSMPMDVKFLDNEVQALPLLESGELDAYVDTGSAEAVFENADFLKVTDYDPLRYSSASLATVNPALEPFISVMQKYLDNGGLDELVDLHKAGARRYAAYRVFKLLTDEEKAYISRHRSQETALNLGYEIDNYPVAFYNHKEKAFQGVAMEVVEQVSRLTGLQFKIANTPQATWSELLTRLERGELALVSEVIATKENEKQFILTKGHYYTDDYALLSRADSPDIDINQMLRAKIGLVEQSAATILFREWFPNTTQDAVMFIDYTTAFTALEKGEIDLLMATTTTVLTLTNYLEKPDFKVNIRFSHPAHSTFGLNKDETVLRSILDKSLRFIDTEEISDRWKRKVFDYNGKMLKDMLPYMLGTLVVLLVGLTVVAVLLLKNRKMSKNLEDIVVQRTSQLAHASRAKSDFLSSMSHEMRTPLNAVIGMAKIAENTGDIARLRYCLSVIGASSAHLLGLINDILDMSKIEAGKLELHNAPLHLEKMLIQVSNLIFAKTEEKMQTLSIALKPTLHFEYMGDELRLSQVLANLLSNAVKFTPEGGVIVLSVDEKLPKKGRSVLRFSVADNGIGMTKEQAGRLFQAFSQADGGIAKRFGGTGLGLAISKNIVEKMNGKIWVESEPDKGTTFFFEVELERLSGEQPSGVLGSRSAMDVRVLVVEGNKVLREDLCSLISGFGMQCHSAQNGEEAMAHIHSASTANMAYNVIFTSCVLADSDCLELVKKIRDRVDPSTVAIAASLSEWSKIEAAFGKIGVHRVLLKPFFPSSVMHIIGEAVNNIVVPSAGAVTPAEVTPDFSDVRLLLVDDVDINREIFISLLEDTGIQIDTAENGREALHAFSSAPEKYDIIVMDVQMPVMDGLEATKAIRSLAAPNAGTVPIIAMTASALREDVDKCLQSGMNDHTAKPIDVKDIMEKIRTLTKKRFDFP